MVSFKMCSILCYANGIFMHILCNFKLAYLGQEDKTGVDKR